MAYQQDFSTSAKRHLRAANELNDLVVAGSQPGSRAVAGYLFGLAGELALKKLMLVSGMRPIESRRDDPFFAHFPELKTLLKLNAKGRRAGELRKYAESQPLFQNWDTNMRYAPTSDILPAWIEGWQQDASDLVAVMDLP